MTSEKQITDLLTRCQYKYKDLSKRDIQATLSYFKELSVVIDKYTYPNGQTRDMITLNGTIPVNYKNSRYNIPIQVFLSDTHPYTPPLSYVRPTSDMSINVSDHIDNSGRVNLPCLREWSYPQSDIYVLLNLMTMKFSEQTPLFSKTNRNSSAQANYQNQAGSGLPYPAEINRPSYPYPNQPYNQSSTPYPVSGGYPMGNQPYPVTNPYYPMPTQTNPSQLSYLNSSNSNIGNVRPASASVQQSTPYPLNQSSSYSDDTIKPEHYKMSLISAVQDKARAKRFEIESLKQAEIDSLLRVQHDLEDGQNHLSSFMNEAENEILNLSNLTIELREKTTNLNVSSNQMQHRDSADIEDAVVTPAPLYRQLLQLFSEELAIQDFIFYLSEGLQHKTINLEIFLKQIRFLTRKQFMIRATMQKARQKAALPI